MTLEWHLNMLMYSSAFGDSAVEMSSSLCAPANALHCAGVSSDVVYTECATVPGFSLGAS